MIHSLLVHYHPLNHHSLSRTNLRQVRLFNACIEAVTCLSVFHQQRYTQDNQSHFIKQTSHFAYVLTAHLLPRFSSSHCEISTFQYTKIYQVCNRVLQDVREGISAANTSTYIAKTHRKECFKVLQFYKWPCFKTLWQSICAAEHHRSRKQIVNED